jgi:YidC/Oxa1 family membrane protein insertase
MCTGLFEVIAMPFKKILVFINEKIGSWALAIILMSLALKALTFPLQYFATKNSKKKQRLQPELERIMKKYADDPMVIQKLTIELFKIHKVNPLSEFIPALVQIPIFIAFFNVLITSPELFTASLCLWIPNLGLPDPYYVFPLLTGLFCFLVQKRSTSKVASKMQKKS